MSAELENVSWPFERAGEAMETLARAGGLHVRRAEFPPPPAADDADAHDRWMEAAGNSIGLEVEPAETRYGEVESLLRRAGPALIKLEVGDGHRLLALVRGRRRSVTLLGPHGTHRLPLRRVRAALCQKFEQPLLAEVGRLLSEAKIPRRRRGRARAAVLGEQLAGARFNECWLLRLPPETSFIQVLRHAGIVRRLLTMACAYALLYLLWIVFWAVVGRGALQGHFDEGWLLAWSLVLLSIVAIRLYANWSQGFVAIRTAGLLKQRLLSGALKSDVDKVRQQGTGQLLARVVESDAVEAMARSGGFLGLFACLELAFGIYVLKLGAAGLIHVLLLAGLVTFACLAGRRYYVRRLLWTDTRFALTQGLVERMVGYRTRAAQEAREYWHRGEDESLDNYLARSREMDDKLSVLASVVPRAWLILGVAGLFPAFVAGRPASSLAISLGGILFTHRALAKATAGITQLAAAAIAWRKVAPLFHQASGGEADGTRSLALAYSQHNHGKRGGVLVEANNLSFRYAARAERTLRGCNVEIREGDRLLLEGSSGSGKSTLASVLTGLRQPESGLLLLRGLDRHTLGGEGWRRRVVAAPQFHENHVLTETFAFNLLMGRRWPPRAEDLREAKSICLELGLGDLLQRMPAGMFQMVGDSGWQLSHGEKSRVYIARALLQGADLIILDESFAALDPETLRLAMDCVLKRAATLLVVAHP
ncbi:MAG TPA: ABC transporter ATP-binding protein [Pyrinomonadaceae bacterium]|nr:ABC transporter ATP-binding protein [Pyrinomonadaceae bacterium]